VTGYERVLGLRIFDDKGTVIYEPPELAAYPFAAADALRTALQRGTPSEAQGRIADQPVLTFIVPLRDPRGQTIGALQLLQLESYIEEDARASRNSIATLTALMILTTTGIVLLVTRLGVARPVEDLARSFREVGSGDLQALVRARHGDEFGRLAQEFNTMCERLEASQRSLLAVQEERRKMEARLRRAARVAALGGPGAGRGSGVRWPLSGRGWPAGGLAVT